MLLVERVNLVRGGVIQLGADIYIIPAKGDTSSLASLVMALHVIPVLHVVVMEGSSDTWGSWSRSRTCSWLYSCSCSRSRLLVMVLVPRS